MLLLCKLWPYLAGGLIGWLLSGWLARRFKYIDPPIERTIEVEKEVEKVVDNPAHLARIADLETRVEEVPNLQNQIQQFKASGPEVVEKVVEKQVDNPAHLSRIAELELALATASQTQTPDVGVAAALVAIDRSAAKAFGFSMRADNDFTIIEGVGPKINELIHNAGIHTFAELAKTDVNRIQDILDAAGPRYKLAVPNTWPEQSDLAANNRWEALKALQDRLDGGK